MHGQQDVAVAPGSYLPGDDILTRPIFPLLELLSEIVFILHGYYKRSQRRTNSRTGRAYSLHGLHRL